MGEETGKRKMGKENRGTDLKMLSQCILNLKTQFDGRSRSQRQTIYETLDRGGRSQKVVHS